MEGTMLAGVSNVAWGAAMVMAGLLTLIAINCVWIVLFRLDTYILFHPREGWLNSEMSGLTWSRWRLAVPKGSLVCCGDMADRPRDPACVQIKSPIGSFL